MNTKEKNILINTFFESSINILYEYSKEELKQAKKLKEKYLNKKVIQGA